MTAQGRLVFQSCQDPNVFSSARVPTEPAAGSPEAGPVIGIIDGILAADEGRPRNQRHTSKRIFERLRDEHGYSGGITIVEHYVLALRLWHREVFVPLRHDPGHAPVDFGDALAKSRGVERKIHSHWRQAVVAPAAKPLHGLARRIVNR